MRIEPFREEDFAPVVRLCRSLGADERQATVMARQLLRRAAQIAVERGIDPYRAMEHLLRATVEGRNGRNPLESIQGDFPAGESGEGSESKRNDNPVD